MTEREDRIQEEADNHYKWFMAWYRIPNWSEATQLSTAEWMEVAVLAHNHIMRHLIADLEETEDE